MKTISCVDIIVTLPRYKANVFCHVDDGVLRQHIQRTFCNVFSCYWIHRSTLDHSSPLSDDPG